MKWIIFLSIILFSPAAFAADYEENIVFKYKGVSITYRCSKPLLSTAKCDRIEFMKFTRDIIRYIDRMGCKYNQPKDDIRETRFAVCNTQNKKEK